MRPEMTGEDGERQVDERGEQALAAEVELGSMAHAAATPKTRLAGTAIAAVRSVSLIAPSAFGSVERRDVGTPSRATPREHGGQRQDEEEATKASAT